jgi:hypothetical protein
LGAVRRQDRPAHRRCGVADQDGDQAGVSGATMCAIASSGEGGPVGGVLSSCGATVFTRIPYGVLYLGHGVCPGQPARPADCRCRHRHPLVLRPGICRRSCATLLRIMISSFSSRRRSESRCRMSCRSPWPCDQRHPGCYQAGERVVTGSRSFAAPGQRRAGWNRRGGGACLRMQQIRGFARR